MSNINQTQDLFALDTVQDLDNKSAAAVSGGVADVLLHSRSGQQGRTLNVNKKVANLSNFNFNNITSSVAVNSGTWRFYTKPNFKGDSIDVTSDTARDLPGKFNNSISSLRAIT